MGEGEGGMIWENGIETCIISYMKWISSPGSMHDTGCLWLVRWRSILNVLQFSSVQPLSHVQLFATPWIAACQAPLSITNSQSSLRFTSIESVMPSSHLILCLTTHQHIHKDNYLMGLFNNVIQLLSHVSLWPHASLSITNTQSLLKLMSIELVMPSNHLILCSPILLLLSILPSIRVFSNESVLHIRWPKYWSFSISPSNEYSRLISFRMGWFDLLPVQGMLKSLLQHHSSKASILQCSAFFIVQLSYLYMTTGKKGSFN